MKELLEKAIDKCTVDDDVDVWKAAELVRKQVLDVKQDVEAQKYIERSLEHHAAFEIKKILKNRRTIASVDRAIVAVPLYYGRPSRETPLGGERRRWRMYSLMDSDLQGVEVQITMLRKQRDVLDDRITFLVWARALMVKHNADTPRAAFKAEGLSVGQLLVVPDEHISGASA